MSTTTTETVTIPKPRIDLNYPRYPQDTWLGRFRHFLDVTDFRTLFASQKKLDESLQLIKDYEAGKVDPPEESLWAAKKLRDATIHPDTGEKIFMPFRLSAFTPVNIIIAWGLLIPTASVPTQMFWQWFNQSYNVCVNHANRNASNTMSNEQIFSAYLAATGVSLSVVVGVSYLVKKASGLPPALVSTIKMLGPFFAAGSAGAANVVLMRYNEIQRGVDVTDEQGRTVGKSEAAGRRAVGQTALSRIATTAPILIVPPTAMALLARTSLLTRHPKLYLPLNLAVITSVLLTALPAAVALFPQKCRVATSALEEKFHQMRDPQGNPIKFVYYNRGL